MVRINFTSSSTLRHGEMQLICSYGRVEYIAKTIQADTKSPFQESFRMHHDQDLA
jgi:hypothetical protein